MHQKAVVLISGGIDSTVVAAIAKSKGYKIFALTVDYGQRHGREIEAARSIAKALGVEEHKVVKVDLREFGGSALTQEGVDVPVSRPTQKISKGIPQTYVPARNIVMLGLALAWGETIQADAVFIGAHTVDYSGYPDCRPEFFKAFQEVSDVGTKRGVEGRPIRIETPIIDLGKGEIVALGNRHNVPFELTWSCYKGGQKACGTCESCVIRRNAFEQVGLEDPIQYE